MLTNVTKGRITKCRLVFVWRCVGNYGDVEHYTKMPVFFILLFSAFYLSCTSFIKWRNFLLENDLTNLLNENENYFLLVKWFLVFTRNTRVRNNFRPFAILDFYQSHTYVSVVNISSFKQFNSNIFLLLSVSNRLLA